MIDVIIPVYRGLAATRRCLESVLRHSQRTPFTIVVVDDATPEPAIAAYVDELAAGQRIDLVRNETNLGFVRSANLGMARHPDRDVVLLNSDTEVANDWLDRLHRAATRAPDVGTATPFSNNATICSYPFEGWRGGTPGTLGLAALDAMFATVNAGRTADLPTAVGFCMYIRRECLAAVGAFDAERFGRGYGEENDFCLRASEAGWRSVLAADVFVFHEGGVSFSDERAERTDSATRALLDRYPDYVRNVQRFIARDSLRPLRAAVDAARHANGGEEARCVLDERSEDRALLVGRLAEIEVLEQALAHAESIVAARDEEIARLRAGLEHAEALALERLAELDWMRATWLWRYGKSLVKKP